MKEWNVEERVVGFFMLCRNFQAKQAKKPPNALSNFRRWRDDGDGMKGWQIHFSKTPIDGKKNTVRVLTKTIKLIAIRNSIVEGI